MSQTQRQQRYLRRVEASKTTTLAPLPGPVPAPEHLGEQGAAVWRSFIGERFATLTPAELHVVIRYCELIDRRQQLVEHLAEHGWSVPGSRPGMRVMSAEATVLQSTEVEMRQQERVLGIGPAYRAKLAIDVLAVDEALAKRDRVEGKTLAQIAEQQRRTA